jgi:type II secretory ATPase GspE/PulE/Tfp pilus assembly ATPase PilB-like protein
LDELGFSKVILDKWKKIIARPRGMILVAGPAGSGRTTTLYASLNKINGVEKSIITVEEPVEYRLPRVRQVQINTKAELTFASSLRSILKQDPNVIVIDEVNNRETAEIALQAAAAGQLVFSVLSTNDAPETLMRIVDMGIGPMLVSSAIIGVLAQRLVRKICPDCMEKYAPAKEALKEIGMAAAEKTIFYRGKGCPNCMNTGYKGRVAIHELIVIDDKIRKALTAKSSTDEIRKAALSAGMVSLKDDGISKIKAGFTTAEEVLKATEGTL